MQIGMFDGKSNYKFNKSIRLIELFGGIGCQAKALENLGIDFEHYRLCDFDKYAVQSYNAIHGTNFVPTDITQIKAEDLGIEETDKYDYINDLLVSLHRLVACWQTRGYGHEIVALVVDYLGSGKIA